MTNNMQNTGEPSPLNIGGQISQPDLNSQSTTDTSGGELSQEQMVANLQELAGKIDGKYQEFNSQKFAIGNKLDLKKREALKEVFDIMSSAGIDLSNPEEVKGFLDSLKEKNPELYQIVESSLEFLFSDGTEVSPDTTTGENNSQASPVDLGQNNMNINTNADINSTQNLS